MAASYDMIVVGARCAGSPTAMLLARKGYRVLLVDRATFPSDTVSTHVVQPLGVAALARWGLLDRLVATECPPIQTYTYDFGPFVIAGKPGTEDAPIAYCPRRTVLDKLLVDAAVQAGAELREGFAVDALLIEDGRVVGIRGRGRDGKPVQDRAQAVIGADGRLSRVAETVGAASYNERPPLLTMYYTYWSGLPMEGRFETFILPRCGGAAAPTHEGLTFVVAGWPYAQFQEIKKDIEGNYRKVIALAPRFAERFAAAKMQERFIGASSPNYFRKPHGPGWALVGDAGYIKDPITAQGISDAFQDAELCIAALDDAFRGVRSFEEAMAEYQRRRDARALPMYEFTCQLAAMDPPSPEMQQLFRAIHGNREAMDDFARTNAGTVSPATFFAPENIRKIMAAFAAAG